MPFPSRNGNRGSYGANRGQRSFTKRHAPYGSNNFGGRAASASASSLRSEFGIHYMQQGSTLTKKEWSEDELTPFKKNFSKLIKQDNSKFSGKFVSDWLRENNISVYSGHYDIMNHNKEQQVYGLDDYSGWNRRWNYDESSYLRDAESCKRGGEPEIPKPIFSFDDTGFPPNNLNRLKNAGFETPTPIQAQGWPMAMSGCDLIGIAQTGSGKTLAFLLPAVVHIKSQRPVQKGDGPVSLIIAPTRELACQIGGEINKFCTSNTLRYVNVYGGENRIKQISPLTKGVEIVVATPGRLLDFVETEVTNLDRVTYLVIDEADRLLDMGFEPSLKAIVGQIRPDKQLLMWSATWPKEVRQLAKQFLTSTNDVYQVVVGSLDLQCNTNITQKVQVLRESSKLDELQKLINETIQSKENAEDAKILVFLATKKRCDAVCDILWKEGFYVAAIHGDKTQVYRTDALRQFREKEVNVLLATDVASRGIHVDNIDLVVNFDFPGAIEDYVHRIGRTGRVNNSGTSVSFVADEDAPRAKELIKVLEDNNQNVPKELAELKAKAKRPKFNGNKRFYASRMGRGGGRSFF